MSAIPDRPDSAPTAGSAPDRPRLGPRFLVVWSGQTVSAIGSMLSGVGISVWVFLETGSAVWLGLLMALAGAPSVLLMPLMGVTDRWPRRRVMIIGDTAAAVSAAGVLALALTDRLQVWQVAVAVVITGAGSAFQAPAFQAAIPELVEPAALGRANGLNQLGPALGITVGPLLAAPLVAWWGIEAIAMVDLVTFGVAVGTALSVRFGQAGVTSGSATEGLEEPDVTARPEKDDGSWRVVRTWLFGAGRPLVTLIATMVAVNFVLAGFNVAVLTLAVEIGGADGAGVPLAVGGAAMLIGSVLVGARGVPARRVHAFALALAGFGAGAFVAALRPNLIVLTVGVAVSLVSVPMVNAAVSTIFHERVPGSMQGRVFAIRTAVGQSLGPVGSLATGAFISVVAQPAMGGDGPIAGSIGRLVGEGAGRAGAFALVVIAVALIGLSVRLARSWIVDAIDGESVAVADLADRPVESVS